MLGPATGHALEGLRDVCLSSPVQVTSGHPAGCQLLDGAPCIELSSLCQPPWAHLACPHRVDRGELLCGVQALSGRVGGVLGCSEGKECSTQSTGYGSSRGAEQQAVGTDGTPRQGEWLTLLSAAAGLEGPVAHLLQGMSSPAQARHGARGKSGGGGMDWLSGECGPACLEHQRSVPQPSVSQSLLPRDCTAAL